MMPATTVTSDAIRIPVKPQKWLFVANLFIQPPMSALFFWMITDAESGIGMKVFAALMGLACAALFAFSVLSLARTWGKTFEIVVGADAIEIPSPLAGKVDRIAFAAIETAVIVETRTSGTSFYAMTINHTAEGKSLGTVVNSQFIGPDAFHRMRVVLIERGVDVR